MTNKPSAFAALPAVKTVLFLLLFLLISVYFSKPVNLATADLGRHIKNGELFWKQGKILNKNTYSYVLPEKDTITHHWASGALFYAIWKPFGFEGLARVYVVLFLVTFCLFWRIARRTANFAWVYFCTVFVVPLLVTREEIRPEGFSSLLAGIYFILLLLYRDRRLDKRWLFILVGLQIFWVNVHILFIFGLILTALFWVDAFVRDRMPEVKWLLVIGLLQLAACMSNPFGFQGVLEPLLIFQDYGYQVLENQSALFAWRRLQDPLYAHFMIAAVILGGGAMVYFIRHRFRDHLIHVLIVLLMTYLAFRHVRMISLFALFFMIYGAMFAGDIARTLSGRIQSFLNIFLIILAVTVMFTAQLSRSRYFSSYPFTTISLQKHGIPAGEEEWWWRAVAHLPQLPGLMPGVNRSAEFFRTEGLSGPIFNNYDIGSYLIFHLYPDEKVFVDNRPEAYGAEFFRELYIPMQENEELWMEKSEEYGLNTIYFFRHDLTPWAQPFLIRRINDPNWVPVYVDAYAIILLKNVPKNANIIDKFRIPMSAFTVHRPSQQ